MDNHMSYLSGKQHMCLKSKQNVAIRCKSNFNCTEKLADALALTGHATHSLSLFEQERNA
jgi:hypothetical protein